jgi:DNA (cytosine-5)-methyltransferase 1
MNYLSVCSGIEAASCAWEHLNWNPIGFSEIEKFPARVLEHHYPNVTNFGDMTNYKEWNINGTVGLLVGGTPCQSFSVAGLREGLKDPRGNLMLTYVGILDHFRPKWFVWENVPGVLSSNEGRDFGSLLGAVADIGYGFAYRVLDAQYFGVAQRRRRVFVVGNLGDWRGPAKVLFESGCLSRDSPPSREKRKEITSRSGIGVEITGPLAARRFAETDGLSENSAQMVVMPDTVGTLDLECGGGRKTHQSVVSGHFIPTFWNGKQIADTITCTSDDQRMPDKNKLQAVIAIQDASGRDKAQNGKGWNENVSYTLETRGQQGVAHAFKVRGGGGNGGKGYLGQDEQAFTISTVQDQQIAVSNTHAFNSNARPNEMNISPINQGLTCSQNAAVVQQMAVRRLTPVECERLQGFPDKYTDILPGGKPTPDGPRYKALGNSMAVPVMRWIGERIDAVEKGML